jgi:hypothetical protein
VTGKRLLVWITGGATAVLIAAAIIYGLTVNVDVGVALLVMGIGAGGLAVAAHGKPSWSGPGLSERVLHRLPESVWRAVMAVVGLAIVIFGLVGVLTAA